MVIGNGGNISHGQSLLVAPCASDPKTGEKLGLSFGTSKGFKTHHEIGYRLAYKYKVKCYINSIQGGGRAHMPALLSRAILFHLEKCKKKLYFS